MRVHELAKELQTDSKTLTGILAGMDIVIKTHFAVLTDEQADKVREIYASGCSPEAAGCKKGPRKKASKAVKKELVPETEPAAPVAAAKVVVVRRTGRSPRPL